MLSTKHGSFISLNFPLWNVKFFLLILNYAMLHFEINIIYYRFTHVMVAQDYLVNIKSRSIYYIIQTKQYSS